jgi:hypothetical protein
MRKCGVSLYWHAQSVETLLPSGKRNPAAGIMLALLAEMARGESEKFSLLFRRLRLNDFLEARVATKRVPTAAPLRNNVVDLATDPCRGLSLSR